MPTEENANTSEKRPPRTPAARRLASIVRYSQPWKRPAVRPVLLIVLPLAVLILALLAVAIFGGSTAAMFFRIYAEHLKQFASKVAR